jgi:hypothetical protein
MPLIPRTWCDDELEGANDGSAAAARDGEFMQVSPSSFNALVCEVQAWRRSYPGEQFVSGPNVLTTKRDLSRKLAKSASK